MESVFGNKGGGAAGEKQLRRLEKLLQLSHKIHSTLELDRALEIVLDTALEMTQMQRGFIMLYNEERELEFRMGRDTSGKPLTSDHFQVSHTVIQKAVEMAKLFYFVSPSEISSESVMSLQIGSGFCVPLFAYRSVADTGEKKKMVGILYEDSKRITRFGKEEEEIANALALHAGLALENASLYELATLDGLTRVYQRRYFDAVSELEFRRAMRHSRPVSVLMVDIDHFKSVNDTFGHDTGDRVLRKTAQVLRTACRMEDIVARYGGEEFVILLPETTLEGARPVAQRILESVSKCQMVEQKAVTVSVGVASNPPCVATGIDQLIKFADLALYRAKQTGRNRFIVYELSNS